MLTDDDLSRQLGSAFRDATDDLEYAGRVPTLRRTGTIALPLAATVAVAGVLVAAAATGSDAPADHGNPLAGPSSSTSSGTGSSPAAKQHLVTDTVKVAGYTFTYRHAVGEQLADDLYAVLDPGQVPSDATPIDAPDSVKAWVGTDPTTGDNTLYVLAPTRNRGDLFALLSPTWTTDQLADLFHNGRPRAVPAITR